MRIVVILLLLANLALFALTRLDSTAAGEARRLSEQVQPDKVKLLTPQQVAALGPAKVAALSDVCVEWGPLSDPERIRAMTELAPLGLGPLVTSRRIETGARVAARGNGVPQSMLVLRDPPQPAVAKLRELAPAYPGTEIRVGGCERTTP